MSFSAITSSELTNNNVESGYANEDQTKTFREFFKTYNTMSQICFNLCVWDFGTNELRYVQIANTAGFRNKGALIDFGYFRSCGCLLFHILLNFI